MLFRSRENKGISGNYTWSRWINYKGGSISTEIKWILIIKLIKIIFRKNVGKDGLVCFLGRGGFGFEFAHSRIIRAVQPLDKVSRTGDGLPAQIDRVGTHVGDFTVLVEPLG